MNRREIAALACRILALWLFTQAATSLVTTIVEVVTLFNIWDDITRGANQSGISAPFGVLLGMSPTLVMIAIGVLLWKKADSVASRMVSDDPAPVTSAQATREDLLGVAYSAMGMFILASSLPELGRTIAQLLAADGVGLQNQQLWQNGAWQGRFWGELTQIAIGLWLLLGSRGIVRALRKLQRPDVETPIPEEALPQEPN
jgi:hypothetical protein